jgi:hypothetical protein
MVGGARGSFTNDVKILSSEAMDCWRSRLSRAAAQSTEPPGEQVCLLDLAHLAVIKGFI